MEHNLLLKACEGDSDAQYKLGISYCIRSIPQQAYYWLQKSAQQGNPKALSLLQKLIELKLIETS